MRTACVGKMCAGSPSGFLNKELCKMKTLYLKNIDIYIYIYIYIYIDIT